MAPRCSDCKFSKLLPNKGRNGDGHEVIVHLCRRYPPQVMVNGQSTYPVVGDDEWCGEFQRLVKPSTSAKIVKMPTKRRTK